MRRALLVPVLLLAAWSPARAQPTPLMQDPLGTLRDVTLVWQDYQPAEDFCIPLDSFDFHPALTGQYGLSCSDDQLVALQLAGLCPMAGCGPHDTYRVRVKTPDLCNGCRRLFIDFTAIGENDPGAGLFYAHGHAYWRMHAWNFTYTIDPVAHSPNMKNFTNDKLVAPEGSIQEHVAHAFDLHAMSYVTDTVFFHHTETQGPYFIGPWYVNEAGETVHGVYMDVDVASATSFGNPNLDEIRYWAGFNAGEATCPDNHSPAYADGDYFYGGCATHPGMSSTGIDPFS